MPTKLSQEKQAWVKTSAPKKSKAVKYANRAEQKEALCARLRYFACKPLDGSDRIRMLNRPFEGANNGITGMVDVDRAPSPVPDQWTGAGLKFENGARGGGGGAAVDRIKLRRDRDRGFDVESTSDSGASRVVSEPVAGPLVISRAPTVISKARTQIDLDDDARSQRTEGPSMSVIKAEISRLRKNRYEDAMSVRTEGPSMSVIKEEISRLRRNRHRYERDHERDRDFDRDHDRDQYRRRHDDDERYNYKKHEDPIRASRRDSHHFHDYDDTKSYRSLSPARAPPSPPPSPPPPPQHPHSYYDHHHHQQAPRTSYERQPDYSHSHNYHPSPYPNTHRPQARNVTAPVTSSRPTPAPTPPRARAPLSSTYKFQSAIFKPKESTNHYRNFYEKSRRDGSVGPASWASATSALSFD